MIDDDELEQRMVAIMRQLLNAEGALWPLQLRADDVARFLSVSRDEIYEIMKTDATFPRPVRRHETARPRWDRAEILSWHARLLAARDAQVRRNGAAAESLLASATQAPRARRPKRARRAAKEEP